MFPVNDPEDVVIVINDHIVMAEIGVVEWERAMVSEGDVGGEAFELGGEVLDGGFEGD